jgi:hypothetical protein
MKRVLAALAALAASACAEDYYGPYGGGGMAYYDDFYGPYAGGYWGPDSYFYYRGANDRRFHRDQDGHFHHGPGPGWHGVPAQPGFHGWRGHPGGPHGGQGGPPGPGPR